MVNNLLDNHLTENLKFPHILMIPQNLILNDDCVTT